MDHAATAAEFFARWSTSFDEMCVAFTEVFAPTCVWDQRPIPRATGPEQAVRFLRMSRRSIGLDTIDVEMLSIAVAGYTVHTQRVDHLKRADGSLIASAPVAGVLTFQEDGLLAHWREYFDAATLASRSTVSGVGALARKIGSFRR